MKKLLIVLLIAAFAAFAWRLLPSRDPMQSTDGMAMTAWGKGIVQHVDEDAAEVTIRHGPMPELNMRPMTMSYRLRDGRLLAGVQPQQEIEFQVRFDGRDYVITAVK